ncbi:hypothetical protein V6N13_045215 [Hibiscus sabdariffa]
MEKLVSSWYKNKSLPESYKFPPETRPGNLFVPTSKTIPVIDLVQNRADIVRQILKSSEEYGFFQVVNHGVPEDVMNGSMDVFKEFFEMPAEDKAPMLHSEDPRNRCRLSTVCLGKGLSLTLSIPKLSASCKSKKQGESKFEFRETIQHPKVLQISNLCKVLKWKELPGD